SIALQSGGLRTTFAPEALMDAAMALNELCLFPESLQMIQTFRKSYERSYHWLKDHVGKNAPKRSEHLYPLALGYLKGDNKKEVPERVASEWIRSPIFQARQQSINVSFSQAKAVPGLIQEAEAFLGVEATKLAALREEMIVKKTTEQAKE